MIAKEFKDFGSLVFTNETMKKYVSKETYNKFEKILLSEKELDKKTADCIAQAMKEWALSKGCTHYTHWFQPLTGATAEKHDAFLDMDDKGKPIEKFNGKLLIKGEPDASSFPSGGLRSTFEARGYTYWDYTSPAFIREKVLCIPSVFVSYYGESLDKKGPLLKSEKLVSTKASELLTLLGYKGVKKVNCCVGLEQEYFLIDRPLFKKRLDLTLCGRTIFGHSAPKGQEFDDHYFGAIPSRVQGFMKEVNEELWKLGIYAKTEHNEVAPMQFELAPLFSNANIAVDQNQLIMDILKRVSYKHGYACLLHEKPFNSINGSGKHNNYSLVSNTGVNVFDIGKTELDNKKFALFTACFIKAVDNYPELLRLAAATPGNDFRLGASEAPPAIISIFLGDYIENLIKKVGGIKENKKVEKNSIDGLSLVSIDNTDRNRTSPVAFTGNKFEFRMLGSSMSAAFPNVVLNTIMAQGISEIIDLLKKSKNKDQAISNYIKDVMKNHSRILYSGDGYSNEWVQEAKKRGLSNLSCTVEAISHFDDDKNVKLLVSNKIFTKQEIEARKDILINQYISSISLEVKTMLSMVESYIIPFMSKEINNYNEIKLVSKFARGRVKKLTSLLDELDFKLEELKLIYSDINSLDNSLEKATRIRQEIVPVLDEIKCIINKYEKIASKEVYTLPTYEEMLY